jgi:hypothetical protein
MFDILKEFGNRIINKRFMYKCIAYVDNNTIGDKPVETFEIREFSYRRAYKTAYELLKFKYPTNGFDIRIYSHKEDQEK